jgi:hypothetical protein
MQYQMLMRIHKLMRKTITTIIILSLMIFIFNPGKVAGNNHKILATIDGKPITNRDFQNYLKLFDNNPKFHPDTPEAKKKLLKHLIDRTILLQYAQEHDYLKLEELQKHKSLNQEEKDTIVLRRLLTDKISNQAHCSEDEIKAYQKDNPKLSTKLAKEKLTSQKQQKLFKTFMDQLKKEHTIIIR